MPAPGVTSLSDVQAAIFDALDGAISCSVFDDVPDGTDFPYVTIGDAVETRSDVHGRAGRNVLTTIDVWGRERGYLELQTIAEEIDTILDHTMTTFTVTGWSVVLIENESSRTLRIPAAASMGTGVPTRHLVLQYRVQLQESP